MHTQHKWTQPTAIKLDTLIALLITLAVPLTAAQTSASPIPVGKNLSRTVGQILAGTDTADSLPGISPALNPASQLYPFRDSYAYIFYGMPEAHAVLTVPQTRLRQVRRGADPSGETFTVDIRLYNDTGEEHSYYNLYWNPFIPMPARLALYDSQKHYVCDLLERMGGSRTTVTPRFWADIPASGYAGMLLSASLPYPTYITLTPGQYYLQMIYLPRVVQSPSAPEPIFDSDHTELFRSNVVPITVLAPTPAKSASRTQTP